MVLSGRCFPFGRGCDIQFSKREGGPVSHWVSNDVTKSQRGQKIGFLCSSLSSERLSSLSLSATPALLTSFLFSAYLGWLLGPLLSLSTGDRIQHRRQTDLGFQPASTCCVEFWHIVLLLNFWGLYYIMLCYIVLYYNLLGVITKVNEIMHVRFPSRVLAYSNTKRLYIYSLCNLLELRDFCPSCLLQCDNSVLLKCYLWPSFPRNFCTEGIYSVKQAAFFIFSKISFRHIF